MLKVLLKKQMAEVFRSYFFNYKKNCMRSKGSIAAMFVLFAFLMVGVLGGTFTFIAVSICGGLAPVGMGWLYFALMSGISVTLGTFGSVFNTYSGLYLPKDNDLLLSMPIPVRIIIMSRLLNVYLLGAMYSGAVMIPSLAVYWAIAGLTALNLICGIMLFVIITLVVLMLSCALGWIIARISLRLKNKSFITVLVSLAFIGGYYFLYFKAQDWIRELVANAAVYGESIRSSNYALYMFGRIGEGDLLSTVIFTAAAAAALALTMFVLSRNFLRLATASGASGKNKYTEKRARQKSAFGALLVKELSRFASSPNYMLNCGLGILLLPAFGVLMLVKGSELLSLLDNMIVSVAGVPEILVCTALMLMSTMNDMAAPSVSLEGKSIWIPQSLPVRPRTALRAKAAMQLVLTWIPMLVAVLCSVPFVGATFLDKLLICLVPMLYALFSALFGVFLGVKNPITEWVSEIIPIKQSGAVMIAIFGGWGFVAVFAALYFVLGAPVGPAPYLLGWTVILIAASALMFRWLDTKGAEEFARL